MRQIVNDISINVIPKHSMGGQQAGSVPTCVQIQHIPTGVIVTSHFDNKSQLRSKIECMERLESILKDTIYKDDFMEGSDE